MGDHIVAIDQGTSSTRAFVFNRAFRPVASAQVEFAQHYPQEGWVEHDPEDIWRDTQAVVARCLADASLSASDVAGIGIANQRETTLVWDRRSGEPVHNAIVWQDRRGEALCRSLAEAGHEEAVRRITGLQLGPYFSASKLAWMLDSLPGLRDRAMRGELAFGTVDSFLLWRLTGGQVHATDATNASRSLLFDLRRGEWSPAMCELFGVPMEMLPEVRDSAGAFGQTVPSLFGAAIPVRAMIGDQQAALVGLNCLAPGLAKATYGTGCFLLVNTGTKALASRNGLLSTIAYRLDGKDHYALEGAIFTAGAAVKWLRDGLGLIGQPSETETMAERLDGNGGVYLVPAFTGLGAPHWRADVSALLTGLTLGTGADHVARAILESVAYQTHDLIVAMRDDGADFGSLRVDGGMAANDWFAGFLADITDIEVVRPAMHENTARGAAVLAARAAGLHGDAGPGADEQDSTRNFAPKMANAAREDLLRGWRHALRQSLTE